MEIIHILCSLVFNSGTERLSIPLVIVTSEPRVFKVHKSRGGLDIRPAQYFIHTMSFNHDQSSTQEHMGPTDAALIPLGFFCLTAGRTAALVLWSGPLVRSGPVPQSGPLVRSPGPVWSGRAPSAGSGLLRGATTSRPDDGRAISFSTFWCFFPLSEHTNPSQTRRSGEPVV